MSQTPVTLSPSDTAKHAAALRSVAFVEDGMKLGLGTGSTAAWMVRALGDRIRDEGLRVTGVATSARTAELARQVGVPLTTLDQAKWLDLTIDGADEFDPRFNLIKGGGAALLQEKIVATASDRMIVIADAGKRVTFLGAFPLPVEVVKFGWQTTQHLIETLLANADVQARDCRLRLLRDAPVLTDENNYIIDLHLGRIGNARSLATSLNQIPGVVENGLFLGLCDTVVLGHGDGTVEVLEAQAVPAADAVASGTTNIFADLGD